MKRRTSVYLDEFQHTNPVPAACRIGNLLVSGLVIGRDPATGKVAPTLDEQCAFMFRHMEAIVNKAGGSVADIIKVTIWMKDRDQREPVNREWLRMFPDAQDRPARQAMEAPLDGGKLVQCEFVAVIGD